jgi:DNA polymerase-3 subunit delta
MLIVLHGSDEFTARAALAEIRADPRYAGNVERFEGASADIRDVRAACATLPFLSEARLVVVEGLPKPRRGSREGEEEPEAPARGKKGSKKPSAAAQARDFVAALADLAPAMPETTTLAVFVPEELPKTSPLLAAAERFGELRAFSPPTGAHLDAWIARRVRDEGAAIAPDALRLLAALTAGDLRLLASEIAKLATYSGPKGTISLAVVERLVPDARETRIFEMTDALTRGDRAQALALAHALIAEGSPPLMLLAMIARQVRMLVQAKDLAAHGARPAEIASAAGIAPFQVERLLAQARRLSMEQLLAAHRACLEADTAIKRSRLAPDLALDLLVADFGGPH